jgi:hypothetical protein
VLGWAFAELPRGISQAWVAAALYLLLALATSVAFDRREPRAPLAALLALLALGWLWLAAPPFCHGPGPCIESLVLLAVATLQVLLLLVAAATPGRVGLPPLRLRSAPARAEPEAAEPEAAEPELGE